MFPEPKRRYESERLDEAAGLSREDELAGTLADIRVVNRFLGGTGPSLAHLDELAGSMPKGTTLRVLDVASGSADIPVAMADWAVRRDIPISVTALDVSPEIISHAVEHAGGRPGVSFMVGDGLRLPFADGAFDIVHCSLALHHFREPDALRMISEMARTARTGIIVSDLRRSWVAYSLIYILTRVFTSNLITRNDGPLSVLRSFTKAELEALGREAGLPGFRVQAHPFWRMALVWRCA